MIKITPTETSGFQMEETGYISGRKGIARLALPITRFLRAVNANRYIEPRERLLDIGCGDGYFLLRSKCVERYGLDKRSGDEVVDSLDFPSDYFDYVTMLAVIEHIEHPKLLLKEIYRVLKPSGRLVLTTPKKQAEFLIRLYAKDIEKEHKAYYDSNSVSQLAGDLFYILENHTFLFGLNQIFCLEKKQRGIRGETS